MFVLDSALILSGRDHLMCVFSFWEVLLFLGILGVLRWVIRKVKAYSNMSDKNYSDNDCSKTQKTPGIFKVICPGCSQVFEDDEAWRVLKTKCPACGKTIFSEDAFAKVVGLKAGTARSRRRLLGISLTFILLGVIGLQCDQRNPESYTKAIRYAWWFRLLQEYSVSCARNEAIAPGNSVYKGWCKFSIDRFGSHDQSKMFAVKDLPSNEQKFSLFLAGRVSSRVAENLPPGDTKKTKLVTWGDFYRRYVYLCIHGYLSDSNRTFDDPDYALWVEYNTAVLSKKELKQLLLEYSKMVEYNFYDRNSINVDPRSLNQRCD